MKMKRGNLLATVLRYGGVPRLLDGYWGQDRLTVLAYHRIENWNHPDFDFFVQNVSATPELFDREMEYIDSHFNVIDLNTLLLFIQQGDPLPPRPCLITFDDGYLDNYENAFPILKKYGFPAVIFLMTDAMSNPVRPWWDVCAYYFHHTPKQQVELPLIGTKLLPDASARNQSRKEFVNKLKTLPDTEKRALLDQLPGLMEVPPPNDPRLFVTWDQVHELVANGVACQPHTVTHPILSRIPLEEQRRQLAESKAKIEAETGQPAVAFAYPNGTKNDYDQNTIKILEELGFQAAFTLEEGPMPNAEVRQNCLEIKRVFLSYKDTLDVFALKVMGLPAVLPGYA